MHGWNMMPLLLAASLALGGLARAAPALPFEQGPTPAEQSYARGLFAALEDPDDEVVAWALRLLLMEEVTGIEKVLVPRGQDTRYYVVGNLLLVDVEPGVRERLLDFLRTPRATQALRGRERGVSARRSSSPRGPWARVLRTRPGASSTCWRWSRTGGFAARRSWPWGGWARPPGNRLPASSSC